jgi:hypothetical protein
MHSSAGQTACAPSNCTATKSLVCWPSASAQWLESVLCAFNIIRAARRPFAYLLSGGGDRTATSISANAVIHTSIHTPAAVMRSQCALTLIMFAFRDEIEGERYCTWAAPAARANIVQGEIPFGKYGAFPTGMHLPSRKCVLVYTFVGTFVSVHVLLGLTGRASCSVY